MIRLLAAEVRRIAARRLVRLTVVLTIAGIVVGGVAAFVTSDSLSEETYQQRVVEAEARDEAQRAQTEACIVANGVARGAEIPDDVADQCFPSDDVAHVDDPRFHRNRLRGVLQGVSGALAVVGVGARCLACRRRVRVTRDDDAADMGDATRPGVPRQGRRRGGRDGGLRALRPGARDTGDVAHARPPRRTARAERPDVGVARRGRHARGVALTALGSAMGFAIATVGRNTAAALGAGFAYIIVLENILGSSIERWRRWLLLGNVIVFVSGDDNGGDVPGRTVTGAGVFLAAVAVTLLVGAAGTFWRRDLA